MFELLVYCAIVGLHLMSANNVPIIAVAELVANSVNGRILFTETDDGVRVTGQITGLPAGLYGFHIHELGDVSTCDLAGAHFNPYEKNHGSPDDEERHVGDLGNIQFVGSDGSESAVAQIDLVDHMISLRGDNSVMGRTLMLHEKEDDLGMGGHELSLSTGNAGARVACGTISVLSPTGLLNKTTTELTEDEQ